MSISHIRLHTDGACNNHGKGPYGRKTGMGIVLWVSGPHDSVLREPTYMEAVFGDVGTSNVAEWLAMYRGLVLVEQYVRKVGHCRVTVRTDSMLVVKQMQREWIVQHPRLEKIFKSCIKMEAQIVPRAELVFEWVRREDNELADLLSKIGRRSIVKKRPSFERFDKVSQVEERVNELYRGKRAASSA